MHKAVAGGEIGANGEFYKGGQFVADDPKTVKGENKWLFESKEGCSVWYHANFFWQKDEEWNEAAHKYETKRITVGHYSGDVKPEDLRFYGYLLSLYLDNISARLSKQEFVDLYFACYPQFRNTRGWFVPSGMTTAECATITEADVPAFEAKIDAAIAAHGIITTKQYCDEKEAARKAAIVSKHIGTPGEKMELDVEVTATIPFESDYGAGTVYKFVDGDGNELVWMTSANLVKEVLENGLNDYAETGDKLRIKFTVKGHDTYCDVPQTKIFRVKAVSGHNVLEEIVSLGPKAASFKSATVKRQIPIGLVKALLAAYPNREWGDGDVTAVKEFCRVGYGWDEIVDNFKHEVGSQTHT